MNFDRKKLIAQLTLEEGRRKLPYFDTEKNLTIGVGRNLTGVGLRDDEIDYLLNNDINIALADLVVHWPWFGQLSDVRQRVLLDMCFNMGFDTLSQFHLMIMAIQKEDWPLAAHEMLQSKWAKQVGDRATKLSRWMETDNDN